jgi:hypothetical protein
MAAHVLFDFPAKITITTGSTTESEIIGNSFLNSCPKRNVELINVQLLGGKISSYT